MYESGCCCRVTRRKKMDEILMLDCQCHTHLTTSMLLSRHEINVLLCRSRLVRRTNVVPPCLGNRPAFCKVAVCVVPGWLWYRPSVYVNIYNCETSVLFVCWERGENSFDDISTLNEFGENDWRTVTADPPKRSASWRSRKYLSYFSSMAAWTKVTRRNRRMANERIEFILMMDDELSRVKNKRYDSRRSVLQYYRGIARLFRAQRSDRLRSHVDWETSGK